MRLLRLSLHLLYLLIMSGPSKQRREIKKAAEGKAAATRKDAAARPHRRTTSPTGAMKRKKKRKVMGEMVKIPASMSSKEQLKPCALTEVPPCTPLTASSNSGLEKSMPWSQLLTLGGR